MNSQGLLRRMMDKHREWLIVGGSFFLFLLLGYIVILQKKYHQYEKMVNQYEQTKNNIANLKQLTALEKHQLMALQTTLKSYATLNPLDTVEIKSKTLDEVFNEMQQIFSSNAIQVDSYCTVSDKKHPFYIERTMSFVLQGTISHLIDAFNQMKTRHMLMSFDDFILSSVNSNISNHQVRFHLTMKSYQLLPLQLKTSALWPIENVAAIHPSHADRSLDSFSLDCLYFVGLLSQAQTIWALIKKPDGSISFVTKGDLIGQEHAMVTDITEQLIRIQENAINNPQSVKKIITLYLK